MSRVRLCIECFYLFFQFSIVAMLFCDFIFKTTPDCNELFFRGCFSKQFRKKRWNFSSRKYLIVVDSTF